MKFKLEIDMSMMNVDFVALDLACRLRWVAEQVLLHRNQIGGPIFAPAVGVVGKFYLERSPEDVHRKNSG